MTGAEETTDTCVEKSVTGWAVLTLVEGANYVTQKETQYIYYMQHEVGKGYPVWAGHLSSVVISGCKHLGEGAVVGSFYMLWL